MMLKENLGLKGVSVRLFDEGLILEEKATRKTWSGRKRIYYTNELFRDEKE